MDRAKHTTPRRRKRNATKRNLLLVLASVLAVIFISVGLIVAYLRTNTEPTENVFTPAKVSCEVIEIFDGATKSDVKIKNTGKTEAFIRAAIVVNWVKTDQDENITEIYAKAPIANTDYEMTFPEDFNWLVDANGFYYHKDPVEIGQITEKLLETCRVKEGANVPDGYMLSVEIIASAIQSSPETVAEKYWNITVDNNKITAVNPAN